MTHQLPANQLGHLPGNFRNCIQQLQAGLNTGDSLLCGHWTTLLPPPYSFACCKQQCTCCRGLCLSPGISHPAGSSSPQSGTGMASSVCRPTSQTYGIPGRGLCAGPSKQHCPAMAMETTVQETPTSIPGAISDCQEAIPTGLPTQASPCTSNFTQSSTNLVWSPTLEMWSPLDLSYHQNLYTLETQYRRNGRWRLSWTSNSVSREGHIKLSTWSSGKTTHSMMPLVNQNATFRMLKMQ